MATTRILLKLEIVLDVDTKDAGVATWDEAAEGLNRFIAENDLPSAVDLKWETLKD